MGRLLPRWSSDGSDGPQEGIATHHEVLLLPTYWGQSLWMDWRPCGCAQVLNSFLQIKKMLSLQCDRHHVWGLDNPGPRDSSDQPGSASPLPRGSPGHFNHPACHHLGRHSHCDRIGHNRFFLLYAGRRCCFSKVSVMESEDYLRSVLEVGLRSCWWFSCSTTPSSCSTSTFRLIDATYRSNNITANHFR